MKYPFQEKQIPLPEAIKFIAQITYPNDVPANARKRVRERIRYAVRTDEIKLILRDPTDFVDAEEFFTWASLKWPEISVVEGLPIKPVTGTAEIVMGSLTASSFGVTIPTDTEELIAAYRETATKLFHSEQELLQLRQENKKLRAEVDIYRNKDSKKRSDGSKFGLLKKGSSHHR